MAVFRSSRLDEYFLTIIVGIENTERVASDFSNECLFLIIDFSPSLPSYPSPSSSGLYPINPPRIRFPFERVDSFFSNCANATQPFIYHRQL